MVKSPVDSPYPSLSNESNHTVQHVREINANEVEASEKGFLRRSIGVLIGKPIPTDAAMTERIDRIRALAVLSSDALSSVAYATEASLAVLITAGRGALSANIPLGILVIVLLALIAISYRQTIFHYPNGGGSYIVAKANLGVSAGLVAAAALMIDYVLTVSVSISAGVDALTSAFPDLFAYSVWIGLALIGVMIIINLRGVRESGTIFAAPTYLFVGSFLLMIVIGAVRAFMNGGLLQAVAAGPSTILRDPAHSLATQHLGFFLILTAFASGCSAMTGTEAISNGVPIFREPQSRNAAQTLSAMALLLGIMVAGTTYLAWRYGLSPQANSNPTLISQMARLLFGGWFGWFYYVFTFATTLILILAANTSFADFPRLSSILARDDYLPHIFGMQGDRLSFNTGIFVLGSLAGILLVIFKGNTDALINLYALGVFAAFTLSQSGMVRRWIREKEQGWRRGMLINLMGAIATGIVTIVIAVAKFDRGAWVVVILVPLIYILFTKIHAHYAYVRSISDSIHPIVSSEHHHHIAVVPIADVNNLALRGLAYACELTPYVIAVHVSVSRAESDLIQARWNEQVELHPFLRGDDSSAEKHGIHDGEPINDAMIGNIEGPELIIISSPLRALNRPVLGFIDMLQRQHAGDLITVILPEFVPNNFFESLLHNQTALLLKFRLLRRPHIVTANVPYRSPERIKHHKQAGKTKEPPIATRTSQDA